MNIQDRKLRRAIQSRCRKIVHQGDTVKMPKKGEIFKDDDFETLFIGWELSFGTNEWRFITRDFKTKIRYRVYLEIDKYQRWEWLIEEIKEEHNLG